VSGRDEGGQNWSGGASAVHRPKRRELGLGCESGREEEGNLRIPFFNPIIFPEMVHRTEILGFTLSSVSLEMRSGNILVTASIN